MPGPLRSAGGLQSDGATFALPSKVLFIQWSFLYFFHGTHRPQHIVGAQQTLAAGQEQRSMLLLTLWEPREEEEAPAGWGKPGSLPGGGKCGAELGRTRPNNEIWGGEQEVASAQMFPCLREHH